MKQKKNVRRIFGVVVVFVLESFTIKHVLK